MPYVEGESAPAIAEWAEALVGTCREEGVTGPIAAEPGRAIVASAALTLYRVGTIKEVEGVRTYLSVDGGMSDNPRPVLYGSGYEVFLPRAVSAPREREVTVVGKHCESGDRLVDSGWVPGDVWPEFGGSGGLAGCHWCVDLGFCVVRGRFRRLM